MAQHDDRLRCLRLADVIVDEAHVLYDLLPAVFIGEIATLALGPAVTPMVVTVDDETSRHRRMRKALITPDVFPESMEYLDDAPGVSAGRPGT